MSHRRSHRVGMLLAALLPLAVGLALLAPVEAPSSPGVPALEHDGLGAGPLADRARSVAALMIDDGLYYLQIARHVTAGAGSTFDGAHATNGYHPLWLLVLAGFATVLAPTGASPSLLLLAYGLQLLLSALAGALLYRVARHLVSPGLALVVVLVWLRIVLVHRLPWSGMEYGLQLTLLLWVVARWLTLTDDDARLPRPPALAALGTLALLATLARLDNLALAVLLGLVLAGWLAVRAPGRPAWTGVLAYATPLVLGLAGYLTLNHVLFGLPTPVSGMLKHDWSRALLEADPRYLEHGWWVAKLDTLVWPLLHQSRSWGGPMIVGSLGAGLVVAVCSVVPATRSQAWRWLPVAGFGAAQLVVHTVWNHGGFSHQPWYFAAQPVLTAGLVALGLGLVWRRVGHRVGGRFVSWAVSSALVPVLILASIASLTGQARTRLHAFGDEPLYAGARWGRAQVPRGERVGSWNAGMIAFLSGRTVVNLDGLVNDRSFYRHGRHDLCGYLDRERIRWLIDVGDEDGRFYDLPQLAPCADRLERVWLAGRGGRRAAAWAVAP